MIQKYSLILISCFSLLAVWIWYDGGAWTYGEMTPAGVYKTLGFTFLAFLCFWLHGRLDKKHS